MRLGPDGFFQLTYCTNIHPSNGWNSVLANLHRYALPLKTRFAPDVPFGIGLRLSGEESLELLKGTNLSEFKSFLDEHGLYVFTLNGFPHGPFHQQPVKADVHAPDWRDEERVRYTLRLVEILATVLPAEMDGGISTSPLSYGAWIDPDDPATWDLLVRNVVRVAAVMERVRQDRGKLIHLDIEPEPDGLLGTCAALTDFFEARLLPVGGPLLAAELDVPLPEARACLLDHIRVCFDACHVAVGYEDPALVLDRFAEVGIRVGKVQVSSAVKVALPDDHHAREKTAARLAAFAESTYLHQVVQRNHNGSFARFPDLPDALPAIVDSCAAEWRIHFHVPIFVERYETFASTQDDLRSVLAILRERQFTSHLEIETYTWDVLPTALKTDLLDSIGREYAWALDVF